MTHEEGLAILKLSLFFLVFGAIAFRQTRVIFDKTLKERSFKRRQLIMNADKGFVFSSEIKDVLSDVKYGPDDYRRAKSIQLVLCVLFLVLLTVSTFTSFSEMLALSSSNSGALKNSGQSILETLRVITNDKAFVAMLKTMAYALGLMVFAEQYIESTEYLMLAKLKEAMRL